MANAPSMKRFVLTVTDEDIERAVPRDSSACLIAQAVQRTYPEATRIDVDLQTIRYTLRGQRYYRLTPRRAQDYLIAFDAGDTSGMAFTAIVGPPIFRRRAGAHGAGGPGEGSSKQGTHYIGGDLTAVPGPRPPTDVGQRMARGRTRRRWFGRRVLRENQPSPNLPAEPTE
jgi:hypothetical protein